MEKQYKFLKFNQYNSGKPTDELIMFSAKAKDLFEWAGIPRKGWHIRMLFQRPITKSREVELKRFWEKASTPELGEDYILGPTAIIVAIQDETAVNGDNIDLTYKSPVDINQDPSSIIENLAGLLLPKINKRLSPDKVKILEERFDDPFAPMPSVENDYVYEFSLQLQQMSKDAQRFIEQNKVSDESVLELIEAMEAVLRPAIVVDGQHRLWGAANIDKDVMLPVVAIPHCPWTEQIYQFVVINEKAQRVDQSLLTDIFGSSLTNGEQEAIRRKLERSSVEIESRIAAVIAGRTPGSPFENMVIVKMEGSKPKNVDPYITERTIRALISGTSQKHSLGWRTDDDFYQNYIQPTIPNREEWESWSGRWKDYWFAFWGEIRNFYNEKGLKEKKIELWSSVQQTNLTKAITLRQMQTLFMRFCISEMQKVQSTRDVLLEVLKDHELVDAKLEEQRRARSLPEDIDTFKRYVREEFLEKGIPVKVFSANWKQSLDDAAGQDELWETLSLAFEKSRKGETFYVGKRIFEAQIE